MGQFDSRRRLHVRWWHASENNMERFRECVGVAETVLALIPDTVQACRACMGLGQAGTAKCFSTESADTLNAQVECDLLFANKHIFFHMLDLCTRWHVAKLIPNKEEDALMTAIEEIWVSTHGSPPNMLDSLNVAAHSCATRLTVSKANYMKKD